MQPNNDPGVFCFVFLLGYGTQVIRERGSNGMVRTASSYARQLKKIKFSYQMPQI
jgi:hypothetical protein